VTGREGDSSSPGVDWEAAAKSGATIVVYMGRGGLKEIASRLIDAGLDAKTPVVVVERASLPNQRAVSGCVDEIASICERESIEAPCITIIGRVAGEYPKLASAKRLPLFGRRVVITRSRGGEEALEAALSALGAEVVRLATIEIRDAADEILAEGLSMLRDAEWVVFTSANGVRTFSGALARAALDSRTLGGRRVAAVGPATARALGEIGICADLVPERFSGEGLLAALLAATGEGERLLLWRARGAREDLAKGLAEAGRRVVEVEAYESVMPSAVDEASVESLKAEPPFAVLFSSASTANNFAQIIGEEDVRNVFAVSSAISIGPATTDALRALGVEPAVEASPHTFDGLVAATLKAAQR
jgi:uroporphyrinogen III methyltransferase/synthase